LTSSAAAAQYRAARSATFNEAGGAETLAIDWSIDATQEIQPG
jgi:hypothetical protein